jgi:hypothetical protein
LSACIFESVGDMNVDGSRESLGLRLVVDFLSLCRLVRGGVGGRCFLGWIGGDESRCTGDKGSVSERIGWRGI